MNTLPINIDRELQELGVLPASTLDDDMDDVRQKLTASRYNTPIFDENGEPDF